MLDLLDLRSDLLLSSFPDFLDLLPRGEEGGEARRVEGGDAEGGDAERGEAVVSSCTVGKEERGALNTASLSGSLRPAASEDSVQWRPSGFESSGEEVTGEEWLASRWSKGATSCSVRQEMAAVRPK